MKITIEDIKNAVFPQETALQLDIRLKLLYDRVLESVTEQDEQALFEEIIELEMSEARRTKRMLRMYDEITPGVILVSFSAVSYYLALQRARTGRISVLADYEADFYQKILSNESMKTETENPEQAMLISETLMDFQYARGATENTSMRIHASLG